VLGINNFIASSLHAFGLVLPLMYIIVIEFLGRRDRTPFIPQKVKSLSWALFLVYILVMWSPYSTCKWHPTLNWRISHEISCLCLNNLALVVVFICKLLKGFDCICKCARCFGLICKLCFNISLLQQQQLQITEKNLKKGSIFVRYCRSNDRGGEYIGKYSTYEEQAFQKAQNIQSSLDSPSFIKAMVRSHVSSCFWLVNH
jgi:hypothetical protein